MVAVHSLAEVRARREKAAIERTQREQALAEENARAKAAAESAAEFASSDERPVLEEPAPKVLPPNHAVAVTGCHILVH